MRFNSLLMLLLLGVSTNAWGNEKIVGDQEQISLNISIYNQNMALVKDVRRVNLDKGINDIAFEGVASKIKPETAILYSDGLQVVEQNYDYDLLTFANIVNKSVGTKVKTLVHNPANGENIFDSATIVSSGVGNPLLQFDYGIDPHFNGQIIFEQLPTGLRKKPTLVAKVINNDRQSKDVSLAYLTNGISWNTNYVAKVSSDSRLNLTGWVTINNESGSDYENAMVQLIAGNVNQVSETVQAPRLMAKNMAFDAMRSGSLASVAEQNISGYHLYTLPVKTTIKDKQTKQISLLEKNGVKYKKEAKISSQLHFAPESSSQFEQLHPDMYYIIENDQKSELGIQLPAGIIRFYENDRAGNLQFIGENSISHTAKGEILRLRLGKFANIFANGRFKTINKVSDSENLLPQGRCREIRNIYRYEGEIKISNEGENAQETVYEQSLPKDYKMLKENVDGKLKKAGLYEWRLVVPANQSRSIEFSLEAPYVQKVCN